MQTIVTEEAPRAIGPYAQAMRLGELVFCSGQIPLDPTTLQLVEGGIEAQTARVLANLRGVLEASGSAMDRVLKTTVFLVSMDDFAAMNEEYARAFGAHKPARSTIGVARLPRDARVEIECIALCL